MAVSDVGLPTTMLLTTTPPPTAATAVLPMTKFVPVSVTATAVPCDSLIRRDARQRRSAHRTDCAAAGDGATME